MWEQCQVVSPPAEAQVRRNECAHVLLLVCMSYYLDPICLLTFLIPCKCAEEFLRLISTSAHTMSTCGLVIAFTLGT